MRRVALSLAAGLTVVGCTVASTTRPAATLSPSASPSCDASLWQHVYHPDRLKVIEQCKTVSGVVAAVRFEPDGDTHIDLQVSDASLVNSKNDQYQHGDLVLEQICQRSVTQQDAVVACQGVPHNQTIPHVGDHVIVTGSYVLDQVHGWTEIHPVTDMRIVNA